MNSKDKLAVLIADDHALLREALRQALGSEEDMEVVAEARDCVRAWGKGRGFILTLGCDFPKTVPLENILALMSMKK